MRSVPDHLDTSPGEASATGSAAEVRARYLELLKKVLTFALWEEPGVPLEVDTIDRPRSAVHRRAARWLAAAARRVGWRVLRTSAATREDRETGRIWPLYAHTMVGRRRLDSLQSCVETVLAEGVPGDLLEAGVWRGGASLLMKAVLEMAGDRERRVFLADSFRGLPPPDPGRYPADAGDPLHRCSLLSVPRERVESTFAAYGLLDDRVVFLEGWFADTLPRAPFERLAVLRLDGDMYGSTMDTLVHAYPRLSPGGYCVVDDYALPGCRAAVDDFRREHGIEAEIQAIDWTGVLWRVPRAG